MKLVIVTGLSGSGRTVALHMLEDLGYYCIDNMPPKLMPRLLHDALKSNNNHYEELAVGIDARSGDVQISEIIEYLPELKHQVPDTHIVFLLSDPEIIIKRYSESRRRHPLSSAEVSLEDAIALERERIDQLAEYADLIVDTTQTNVHQLRQIIREEIAGHSTDNTSIMFRSFAFKRGRPATADFVFDVRHLPNPYWVTGLRELTGRDAAIQEWLSQQEEVNDMFTDIVQFLEKWLPRVAGTNRSYITIAIGCTGGRHRSVYMVERLSEHFKNAWSQVLTRHSETVAA